MRTNNGVESQYTNRSASKEKKNERNIDARLQGGWSQQKEISKRLLKIQIKMTQWKSEAQFQAACVKWFDATYPQQRGRLIGIFNNPRNASQLISMGLRPGISDLLYFPITSKVVWIELKIGGNKQSDSQLKWQELSSTFGHNYHVVTEHLQSFQSLINFYQ